MKLLHYCFYILLAGICFSWPMIATGNVTSAMVTASGQTTSIDIDHGVPASVPPKTAYTIHVLPLPSSHQWVWVSAINDLGQVAGGYYPFGQSASSGILWTNRQPTVLPNLGGAYGTFPMDLNNEGTVVGYSYSTAQFHPPHAFLWTSQGGMRDINVGLARELSEAVGISETGQVLMRQDAVGTPNGLVWTESGHDFLSLSGYHSIYPSAMSSSGVIAAVAVDAQNFDNHPFIQANGMRTFLNGGGTIYAVNDQRQSVGQSEDDGSGMDVPAYWNAAGARTLLVDAPGTYGYSAYGINEAGAIVGTADTFYESVAVYWRTASSPGIDLNTVLSPEQAVDWQLESANAINRWGQIAGTGYYQGSPAAFILTPQLLFVDANRDGVIKLASEDASDATSVAQPYRFWINDDDDSENENGNDEPGQAPSVNGGYLGLSEGADWRTLHGEGRVDGTCDLIDFFPIHLDLKQLLTVLPHSATIKYKLKHEQDALNFVHTRLTRAEATSYQTTDKGAIFGKDMNKAADEAETLPVTTAGTELSSQFLDLIQNGNGGVILVEGCKPTTKPLVLSLEKDGAVMAEVMLELSVDTVERMYRWVNVRAAAGQDVRRATDTSQPSNLPDSQTNGKMFVMVHGYNVDEQQSRSWCSEAFKRLFWSGSQAMFAGVSWHGDESQIALLGVAPDYWQNVTNAFATAPALASAVRALPGALKTIAAHSLGNIVTTSAIKDHGMLVANYFMLNAAVATEAYNGSALNTDLMRNPDWPTYNTRVWASEWHQLFPAGDGRRGLSWHDRFGSVSVAYNFYSTGEEVLNNATGTLPPVGAEFSWVMQEMAKGRSDYIAAVLVGGGQAGWGFNPAWEISEVIFDGFGQPSIVTRRRTPAEANLLTDAQLQAQPFFRRFRDDRLMDVSSGSAAAAEPATRAQALAEAIPALSVAAGRNPIAGLGDRNISMTDLKDEWPRADGRWRHSDAKNVAYRFNHRLWETWVQLGKLR